MTSVLTALVLVVGVVALGLGLVRLAFVPLALVFAVRERRAPLGPAGLGPQLERPPTVSVVVPAFDEAVVIERCVESILASGYPHLEVVCVDDGSDDDTFARMQRLAARHPAVQALGQPNAGKGAALNTGIAAARGEVLVLVDADGLFRSDTLTELLRGFRDERVGAVCGNDQPGNLDRVLPCLLALVSHVGTGLARRALDVVDCVPVISGNLGAFRREVLDEVGPLRTDTLGEDLELTWRVHRAGYRVAFAPRAMVFAESPSTLRGLWRQRVRWGRGLLQAISLHRDMLGRPRYGLFGPYLVYNTATQVAGPFLWVLGLVALVAVVVVDGTAWLPADWLGWLLAIGLPASLALLLVAVLLDRAARDLRLLWTVPLWPLYSTLMTFVMLDAVRLELQNAENRWNKLERTGTVAVRGPGDHGPGS